MLCILRWGHSHKTYPFPTLHFFPNFISVATFHAASGSSFYLPHCGWAASLTFRVHVRVTGCHNKVYIYSRCSVMIAEGRTGTCHCAAVVAPEDLLTVFTNRTTWPLRDSGGETSWCHCSENTNWISRGATRICWISYFFIIQVPIVITLILCICKKKLQYLVKVRKHLFDFGL